MKHRPVNGVHSHLVLFKMMRSSAGSVTWTPLGLLLWVSIFSSMEMSDARENRTRKRRNDDDGPYHPPMGPDMSVCEMMLEGQQPVPYESVPWQCICSHCKGTEGPKGDQGDRGLPGSPGSTGIRGSTGFKGPPGFRGPPGLKGQKGDEGAKGELGYKGLRGPKGETGYKGDKGDHGLEGLPGQRGPQGEAGQCQEPCLSIEGPRGPPGLPGLMGPRGLVGAPGAKGAEGAVGPKGDTGVAGIQGQPGRDGLKGEQGEEGTCDCQDGADGINGSQGPAGPKGGKGDTGVQGVKGDTGEKGDMGEHGMMGMPGPCSPAVQSAFSASLGSSFPEPNRPVSFTRIHYNVLAHFDPAGNYTAPVNGTYIFSYNLAVSPSKELRVGLFHNFLPVVKSTGYSGGSASQQVVLHLSRGDKVWLQVKNTWTNGMYTSHDSLSTFSGFLLHPDTCDMPMFRFFFPPPPIEGVYSWGGPLEPEPSTPEPSSAPEP